jgi:hypothetical protein
MLPPLSGILFWYLVHELYRVKAGINADTIPKILSSHLYKAFNSAYPHPSCLFFSEAESKPSAVQKVLSRALFFRIPYPSACIS